MCQPLVQVSWNIYPVTIFQGFIRKQLKKIVAIFPENTIDGILDEPDRLSGVLTAEKLTAFVKRLSENHGMEKILAKLAKYELPSKINFQIYELYKEDTLDVIKANPYQLVFDIKGIGFKKQIKLLKMKEFQRQVMSGYRLAWFIRSWLIRLNLVILISKRGIFLEKTIDLLESARNVEILPNQVVENINFRYLRVNSKLTTPKSLRIPCILRKMAFIKGWVN